MKVISRLVLLLLLPALSYGQEIDPSSHLIPPTEEELATRCDLDLRPLTWIAESSDLDFACTADGILTEVWLAFPPSDPFEAVSELFWVLGLEVDPEQWELVEEVDDEESTILTSRFVRHQSQGLPVAGSGLVVQSLGGRVFQIRGPIVELPPGHGLTVQLGELSAESLEDEVGGEVEGPFVVQPGLPWDEALAFGAEPIAVFSARVEGSTFWFDTFGTLLHETMTRPPIAFTALQYYEDGCRTSSCVGQAVDSVLALKGMIAVQNDLRTRKRYGSASGRDVVIELLREYRPWLEGIGETAVDRAKEALRVHELFRRVFRSRSVPVGDREFLANVVHAIWVELNLHRGPTPEPGHLVLLDHPRIGWSLDDYSPATLQNFLLGDAFSGIGKASSRRAFQFLHYPKAADILRRMAPHHLGLTQTVAQTIPRLLEFAADNQIHINTGYVPDYTAGEWPESSLVQDLSEGYQRRLGGCGLPSQMATLLARAVNLPAAAGYPPARAEDGTPSLDGHRHVVFPTLGAWVHGDSLASAVGIWGVRHLRPEADVRVETSSQHFSHAIRTIAASLLDLENAKGLMISPGGPVLHTPDVARSWGHVNTAHPQLTYFGSSPDPAASAAYARARFGILGATMAPNELELPTTRYSLLDEVALYLPLDGHLGAGGAVENRMLRGLNGTSHGGVLAVSQGGRGGALHLSAGSRIEVPDQPSLHRGDQELSLSLHYTPTQKNGAIVAGTLLELRDLSPGAAGPFFSLKVDSIGRPRFEVRDRLGWVTASAPAPLSAIGSSHLVVTYGMGGKVRLFVNGSKVQEVSFPAGVDFGAFDTITRRLKIKPAQLQLGGGTFEGTLDELILFVGELSEAEVAELAAWY